MTKLLDMYFEEVERRVLENLRGYSKRTLQDAYLGYTIDSVWLDEWFPKIDHTESIVTQARIPDWKHPIPNPDPTARGFSSPSAKTRARLRAKRKKR